MFGEMKLNLQSNYENPISPNEFMKQVYGEEFLKSKDGK